MLKVISNVSLCLTITKKATTYLWYMHACQLWVYNDAQVFVCSALSPVRASQRYHAFWLSEKNRFYTQWIIFHCVGILVLKYGKIYTEPKWKFVHQITYVHAKHT